MAEEKKNQDALLAAQPSLMVKEVERKEDGRILYFYSFVANDTSVNHTQSQSTPEAFAGEGQ